MKVSGKTKAWIAVVAVIASLFATLSFLIVRARTRIEGLREAIASLEEEAVPLKFKILSKGSEGLSYSIRFYDRDGKKTGSAEGKLPGKSLFIDFEVLKNDGAYVAFPARAFTDEVPSARGQDLFRAYDDGGFPAIFRKSGMETDAKRAFSGLFLSLRLGKRNGEEFGSAVHDVAELGSFKTGSVYKIVARKKGGIEVMED
jgi:hypothetical protein